MSEGGSSPPAEAAARATQQPGEEVRPLGVRELQRHAREGQTDEAENHEDVQAALERREALILELS